MNIIFTNIKVCWLSCINTTQQYVLNDMIDFIFGRQGKKVIAQGQGRVLKNEEIILKNHKKVI